MQAARPQPYHAQIAAADGVAIAAGLTGALLSGEYPVTAVSSALAWSAMIGPSAVHYAHGRPGTALLSMAERLVVPMLTSHVFALFGCVFSQGNITTACAVEGGRAGFLIGAVVAAALDAVLLAAPGEKEVRVPDTARWYGWQTLILDGAGMLLGMTRIGRADPTQVQAVVGVGAWLIGLLSPVVHAAHGEWGKAAGALTMRLFLTPLLVATATWSRCAAVMYQRGCTETGVAWGALAAATAVAVIDAGAIAYESPTVPSARPRRRTAAFDFHWTPIVAVDARGGQLGVAAAF